MRIKVVTDCKTEYLATVEKSAKLTPHFTLEEMANNAGDASLPQYLDTPESRLFMRMLEEFRVWFDKPMIITSGYRQPAYNAKIGGDSRSAHKMATAADWKIQHTDIQREHVRDKWRAITRKYNVVGAINFYTHGYHLEAYSDKCYGNRGFVTREYRGTKKDW